jgi:hypothetical protein
MHRHWAAGIAALGVVLQGYSAFPATSILPPPPRFELSPGEYTLQITLFEDALFSDEAEAMKLTVRNGKIVLELAEDSEVQFVGPVASRTVVLRYGEAEESIVLQGNLTADDRLSGQIMIESYGYGAQHGTFTLTKRHAAKP